MKTIAILFILSSLAVADLAYAAQRVAVATTTHFAFYSDLDTNINDALITAGLARKNKSAELFHEGDEAACFDKLPPFCDVQRR